MEALSEFKYGAAALAQYSLSHRSDMWHLLHWRGKHSQAPIAVASKPHYFCELDIPATIADLSKHCPEFWTSDELANSIRNGDIFKIDGEAWAQEMESWLMERSTRSTALYRALGDFIETAPWRQLCQRLLPVLPEKNRAEFAVQLLDSSTIIFNNDGSLDTAKVPFGLFPGSFLVFNKAQWVTYEDILVVSAMVCSAPQLLRMLREEESISKEWDRHISEICKLATPQIHWGLRKQLKSIAEVNSLHEMLAIHSFIAYTALRRAAAEGETALKALLTHSDFGQVELLRDVHIKEKKRERGQGSRNEKKRRKKKKRKRREEDWLSDSSSEEGKSGEEDERSKDTCRIKNSMWKIRNNDSRLLSTLELLDKVMEGTMHAYVGWLENKEGVSLEK